MTRASKIAEAAAKHEAAAAEFAEASSEYEAALLSRDPARRAAADARLQSANGHFAKTLAELVAARRSLVPSFEALLHDPATQPDQESAVLASIVAYAAAAPASAGSPIRAGHVYSVSPVGTHDCPAPNWDPFSSRQNTPGQLTAVG